MPAAVTPSGVRDGDPAALAGLCAVRGPSVLAYCRHVAGEAAAGDAAADAFASFRAAVLASEDLADLNPEALLISATRAAAAGRADHAPVGVCAVVPLLLAARADRAIAPADLDLLEQHLESCWTCRAPVARFNAAERAYRDPPEPLMDPAIIASIIAAMAAAAPPAAAQAPAVATNGSGHHASAAEVPPAAEAQARAGAPPAAQEHPPAAVDHATAQLDAPGVREQPAEAGTAAAADGGGERARPARRKRTAARASAGARIPRAGHSPQASLQRRSATAVPASRDGRSRSRSRLPIPMFLPVAVVLVALLAALFVAGVLGGADPASSPRVAVPAAPQARSEPADVVVVPGAGKAAADEVESAKATERARARRQRQAAASEDVTAAPATPPRAAATAPPAAAAPVTAPPPPPPARRDGDGSRKVDAGSGATGAEQIPQAEDTSTVPDLAPAPEPATAP